MPIPTLITDLSQTAGSNYPAGSDSPSVLDDVQRAHAGFIAQLRDGKGQSTPLTLASATTTDIGGQNSQFVEISGTTTITSLGTNYTGIRYLRFTGVLTLTHNSTALNINGGASIVTVAGDTAIAIPNTALNGWNVFYVRNSAAPGGADYLNTLRIDVASAATTDLTANAPNTRNINITGTTTITAFTIASGQTYFVRFNAVLTLTNNGAIVTQTGSNITTAAGDTCIIRSTASNVIEVLSYVSGYSNVNATPPVRQTVLSGTVDSNGFSNFGGSTGSTTVTASSTLIATAANGTANRTGSIVNPSWTGLSTNGTMYLGLTVNADGTCTTFSTTLAPTYQWGGTFSVTANQRTFNIQAMQMQVGNGASAAQAYDVFVGEVTVAGGVVTAIVWYALMGRYTSATTSTIPASSTTVSANHNIGVIPKQRRFIVAALSATGGYAIGEENSMPIVRDGSSLPAPATPVPTRNGMKVTIGASSIGIVIASPTSGSMVDITGSANFSYRFEAERGW